MTAAIFCVAFLSTCVLIQFCCALYGSAREDDVAIPASWCSLVLIVAALISAGLTVDYLSNASCTTLAEKAPK